MIPNPQSDPSCIAIIASRANNCLECGKCTARCPIARVDKTFSPVQNIALMLRGYGQHISRDGNIWACMLCEACSTACPADVDYPHLMLAWRYEALVYGREKVHRLELEQEFIGTGDRELFGIAQEMVSVRSVTEHDKNGVVTSLLVEGMRAGLFDAAVVVRRGGGNRPESFIAENCEDIINARGSKYELVPMPERLIEAIIERGYRTIAVVGLPCQVTAIREIQRSLPGTRLFIIGLFCMENFSYPALNDTVHDVLNIKIDSAERVSIQKGEFTASYNGKSYSCKVKELDAAVRNGCRFCTDFTSELADISVGMVGSSDGYSTVIIRTRRGEDLFDLIKNRDQAPTNREEVDRISSRKAQHGTEMLRTGSSRWRGTHGR